MAKAALLTADTRLAFQVQTWMKEMSDVSLEVHSDLETFTKMIQVSETAEAAAEAAAIAAEAAEAAGGGKSNGEEEPAEKKASVDPYIRLLIVDIDILSTLAQEKMTPLTWVTSVKKILAEHGRTDPAFSTRIMFMAFEGGGFRSESLRHDEVDDLILKPLDRSLFMQKVELLVSDKPGAKPSFLYRQNVVVPIEVGKDTMIDEVSGFAIGIRNPTPLVDGVFAVIHSEIFGNQSRVIGRVYRSDRHPVHEGEYLVRFALFGVTAEQLHNVRKYVRGHVAPARMRAHIVPMSESLKLQLDQAEIRHQIAVIDMNRDAQTDIERTLEGKFIGVKVRTFPSYTRFLADLAKLMPEKQTPALPGIAPGSPASQTATPPVVMPSKEAVSEPADPAAPSAEPQAPVPALPGGRPLVFIIQGDTRDILKFESEIAQDEHFLGRGKADWMDRPGDWHQAIESADKEEFGEFIEYVQVGGRGQSYFRLHDETGKIFFFDAAGTLERAAEDNEPSRIRIQLTEIDEATWNEKSRHENVTETKDPTRFRFAAIYVDAGVIRGEVQTWLDGLAAMFQKCGVMSANEPMPQIIIMVDDKSQVRPDLFRIKGISDFIYKPLDRKLMVDKIQALIPTFELLEDIDVSTFVPCEVPARMAKEAVMEEVSEYGLSIGHPTPFRAGVFMRFFSPLFTSDSRGIIGRCTHCDAVKGEKKTTFKCHFIFFGCPEEVLMRIRTWIREDYVHKKEASPG